MCIRVRNWAIKDYQNAISRGVAINNPAGFILDQIQEYDESEVTAEDIFRLVEKFEAEDEAERIKRNKEDEQKKAEAEAKETERKAHRKEWKEWEIKLLAENFVKNGNKFSDADKKFIEMKGWRTEEILRSRKYMRYFYPGSETIQSLAHKNSNEKKENH